MHYKKRKLHKLHSIPIGLCHKEKLYLVSYSIPLSCMVVLLLGLGAMVDPEHFTGQKGYAIEITDGKQVTPANLEGESNRNDASGDTNNDMARVARAGAPSLGLEVTNSDRAIEAVQGGDTAYSDHLVTISGEKLDNYTLSMSSSSANLTKPTGASGTNITGAGGVAGDDMTSNHWGYAVTEESNSSYGRLTYNTVPTTATEIAKGDAAADGTLNAKKKIVIAAKFGEDAASGTYRQSINLSAVATATMVTYILNFNSNDGGTAPTVAAQDSDEDSVSFTLPGQSRMLKSGYKFLGWSTNPTATAASYMEGSSYTVDRSNPSPTLYAVWQAMALGVWSNGTSSGTTTMQGVRSGFCASSLPVGATITLRDSRDNKDYMVVKLRDNKCWMQENLKLNLTKNTTVQGSTSSGAAYNWSVPNLDTATTQAYATSGTWALGDSMAVMSRAGDGANGNYYTWN